MSKNIPTSLYKNNLKDLYTQNINLTKNRTVEKEVNNIKYQVLHQNNLGHKTYDHIYEYTYDIIGIDDYFSELLNRLVIAFPDSEITYTTTDVTNGTTSTKTTFNNSSINQRPTYANNGNKQMKNVITIDWTY